MFAHDLCDSHSGQNSPFLIAELAQNGSGILLISDELPELIGLADRIIVIGQGRKTFEFNRGEVNQSQLLEAVVSHENIRAV